MPPNAPVRLENSRRLEALLRDGAITLSLEDAIALALENNLDLELVRYAPRLAETDLLRAQSGSRLLGIPLSVREAPAGLGGPTSGPDGTLGGEDWWKAIHGPEDDGPEDDGPEDDGPEDDGPEDDGPEAG